MGTVASELKSEREKRKIPLAQIAAETRISMRHLESLEEGRFNDLPGGMYNRAFLRAYCEILNLTNLPEIMQRYENELAPASERPARSRVHIPQQSRSFQIGPPLIWGLMLLISATGLFFSRNWITAIFSPYFSHTPQVAVRYEPAPKPQAPPPVQNSTPPFKPMEPVATAQGSPIPSQLPVAEPQMQPGMEPKPPALDVAAAVAPASLHLEINATERCWVSVDRDGSPAFRKTMEPGEVQLVNASEKFQIILGNAGGVHLKLNGKPAKQLGKPGEVVKFLIDGKNLQAILDQAAG